MRFFVILTLLPFAFAFAQPMYEEHFEGGVTALDWHPFFESADTMQVVEDATAPDGDGYVGKVIGFPFGMAFAGELDLTDYSIAAYVYVTVDNGTSTGPYQGLTARTNFLTSEFYYYAAEFDTDQRLRLYYLQMTGGMPVIRQLGIWTESEIPGGVPAEDGWHHMKFKLIADSLWAYWNGEELPGCPIIDDDPLALVNGYFGVYAYIFSGECETKVDDIFVFEEPYGVQEGEIVFWPEGLTVTPNPFRSEVLFTTGFEGSPRLLRIYDGGGRLVASLVPGSSEGELVYRWTGRDETGRALPGGLYLYRLDGEMNPSGKVILLR
jgi:hypothetical protein